MSKYPDNQSLDESKILEAVLEGIDEANQTFGTSYYASKIKYYSDDSARYRVYHMCAYWLVGKLSGNL